MGSQTDVESGLVATCPKCGTNHKGDNKLWPYVEGFRARFEGERQLPEQALGSAPYKVSWSHYARKEAGTCTVLTAGTDAYVRYLQKLSAELLPEGDKALAPYLSAVPYGRKGRSFDNNCEAIYFAFFDVDTEEGYENAKRWAEANNLEVILQRSYSRKGWHFLIPLSHPLTFRKGDDLGRRRYKAELAAINGYLSGVLGLGGVGGKCGFDLRVNRLIQPMFVPQRRQAEDEPVPVEHYRGARSLNWQGLLDHIGFDFDESLKYLNVRQQAAAKKAAANGGVIHVRAANHNTATWGPLGKALTASGMIGRAHGFHGTSFKAECVQRHVHSTQNDVYGRYFPGSDSFWCPSTTCRSEKLWSNVEKIVGLLPKKGQEVYRAEVEKRARKRLTVAHARALSEGEPTFKLLVRKAKLPNLEAWVEDAVEALEEEADKPKLMRAVLNVAGRLGAGPTELERVAMLFSKTTDDAWLAMQRAVGELGKKKLIGGRWIRSHVGEYRALNLSVALAEDLGAKALDAAGMLLGRHRMQGDNAEWLRAVALTVPDDEPGVKAAIERPTGCGCFTQECFTSQGDQAFKAALRCETMACPGCWQARVNAELSLVRREWLAAGVRSVVVGEVTVDLKDYDLLKVSIKRRLRTPKIKFLSMTEGGRVKVVFVSANTDLEDDLYLVRCDLKDLMGVKLNEEVVISTYYSPSRGLEEGRVIDRGERGKRYVVKEPVAFAVKAAYQARLSWAAWHAQLVDARDAGKLIDFYRWLRPRNAEGKEGNHKLYTNSPSAKLRYPNREEIRAEKQRLAAEAVNGEETQEFDLTDATYVLKHTQTDVVLGEASYPWNIDQAIRLAKVSYEVKENLRDLERLDDYSTERIEEINRFALADQRVQLRT